MEWFVGGVLPSFNSMQLRSVILLDHHHYTTIWHLFTVNLLFVFKGPEVLSQAGSAEGVKMHLFMHVTLNCKLPSQ